ncbi:cbb3-type cytochrome c oxidase N-terminal domain-containing protein [Sediminibacterium ginsengisoli]|uniref:Cytochrome c oxidase cbb3-type subunit 3 n=1 Tax=Sediminibacterium ginsengisoli TaxID=413434 RepID=A0A1T4PC29_9BACT|nr:cbb3-type cytochrome c oxidase N-terminal domain-containing protein [Sediminibacterium ginsengisoli]SJZ88776.1 cytochrome c oxidase cbb3-type subunit 3 [Sediminibacterium ginsengisoli]
MLLRLVKDKRRSFMLAGLLLACSGAMAQTAAPATAVPAAGNGYEVARYVIVIIAFVMACVIAVLGSVLKVAAAMHLERVKEEEKKKADLLKPAASIFALLLTLKLSAQDVAATAAPAKASYLPWDITLFLWVLGIELAVILFLVRSLLQFLPAKKAKTAEEIEARKKLPSFFQKINKTVPLEQEHTLDLQHNYDGIRELDNNIPGWWKIAFYGTIVFAFVYLYRMFVAESMPTQLQELARSNEAAAIEMQAYLANAANNVDEKTVTMLDAAGIGTGHEIFIKNCAACHGDKGQGGVGPNLTDEYWLHKGSLKDVFYSIKYGWPEKGMKSWKEDLSPVQIAQVASYIKSIKGSNPPAAKEKQGELFEELAADSVVAKQ